VRQSQPDEALSICLADNTSARERRDMARWVFLAMAAHPEIKQYANTAALEATEEAHKNVAAIFTRLVTEACVHQTRAAVKAGGAKAVEVSFRTLGQLAMQELMSNPAVTEKGGGEVHV
jgi:hypothetical protein